MRRYFLYVLLFVSVCLPAQSKKYAGTHVTIMLANGFTTSGTIVEHVTGKSITIRQDVGGIATYYVDEILSLKKTTALDRNYRDKNPQQVNAYNRPVIGRKDPGLAFVLSLLFTGAGQFYNGQSEKGGVMFIMSSLGAGIALAGENSGLGLSLFIFVRLWSLIDAPVAASNLNRKNGYAHLLQRGKTGLDLAYTGNAPGARVTFHF